MSNILMCNEGECTSLNSPCQLMALFMGNFTNHYKYQLSSQSHCKLEQLERLRSEDTPRRLMITHTIVSCWIPSQNKVEWPWRYRSSPKVITCDTPSHASNHLYQIWKESIQNYRRYRADTIFKVKAEWPWKYRSRSKVIICNTPSNANDDLWQIWKEYKQNCRFFSRWNPKNLKNLRKIKILEFCDKLNMRHTL